MDLGKGAWSNPEGGLCLPKFSHEPVLPDGVTVALLLFFIFLKIKKQGLILYSQAVLELNKQLNWPLTHRKPLSSGITNKSHHAQQFQSL